MKYSKYIKVGLDVGIFKVKKGSFLKSAIRVKSLFLKWHYGENVHFRSFFLPTLRQFSILFKTKFFS